MNKFIVYSCYFLLGTILMSCETEKGELIDASKSENYYYSKDKKTGIYDNGMSAWLKVYSEFTCDTATLEILNSYYAKDKDYVYFLGHSVKNVDAKSFYLYDGNEPRDKNYVFERPTKIPKDSFRHIKYANPKFYKELSDGWYMDDKHYFRNNELVRGVDYETFEVISPGFAKDKRFLVVANYGTVNYPANTAKLRMIKENRVITDGEQVFAFEKENNGKMIETKFNIYTIKEYREKHPHAMKRFDSIDTDSTSY